MQLPETTPPTEAGPRPMVRERKMLLVAVALASGVTLECSAAGIGLFDSGLGCEQSTGFSSYCGVVSVTTNCGVSVSCDGTTQVTCTFPTPAKSCELTVKLQDGTERMLPVFVQRSSPDCGNAGIYGIALPLACDGDAGALDASDAMTDAMKDASSDVAIE